MPWKELFTAAADPLTLSITPESANAVSAEIGSDGGTLSATAGDGTVFTLEIPANDLAFPVLVTMTPTASVGGFPDEATPQHTLGVELEPDGLQLGVPATLTIAVADSLATHQVAAMDYATEGANAGFHYFTEESDTLSLSIDHFSGYVALYPIDDAAARVLQRRLQALAEDRLRSEIAALLTFEQQRQKLGLPPNWDLAQLAANFLPDFVELVLKPRVAAAGAGCTEAEAAMTAFAEYERHRQLLGVADHTQFNLYGVEWLVPDRLVDLAVRLCFRQAHAYCVQSGDLPGMGEYFLTFFLRNSNLLGIEPISDQIQLAHDYLRRCGHYRIEVKLSNSGTYEATDGPWSLRQHMDLELEWKPGASLWGFVGSTIEGPGEIILDEMHFTETWDCEIVHINPHGDPPPYARITKLAFARVFGPTPTGQPLPPQPSQLELEIAIGIFASDEVCGGVDRADNHDLYFWAPGTLLGRSAAGGVGEPVPLDEPLSAEFQSFAFRIGRGWMFTVQPFKAVQFWANPRLVLFDGANPENARIEITLTHDPS